jgi:hypothetical protein
MDAVHSIFRVTLCAAAHVDIQVDVSVVVQGSSVSGIFPVDPRLGIGSAIILLKDGSSLNILQSPEELIAQNYHLN